MDTLEELLTSNPSESLGSIPPPEITGTDQQQIDRLLGGVDMQQMLSTMGSPAGDTGKSNNDWLYEDSDISKVLSNSSSLEYGSKGDGMGDGPARRTRPDGSSYPDPDLPASMQDFTGMRTWGEFLGAGFKTAITGIATITGGPIVGTAMASAIDVAGEPTESNVIAGMEDTVMSAVDKFGISKLAQTANVYNRQDGIINSIMDAGQSLVDNRHAPTTVAGWMAGGGLDGQISRNRADVAEANGQTISERELQHNYNMHDKPSYDPSRDESSTEFEGPRRPTHTTHHGDGPTRHHAEHETSAGGPSGSGETGGGAVSGGR